MNPTQELEIEGSSVQPTSPQESIWIEVLDANHDAPLILRLKSLPIRVGRSFENDIILAADDVQDFHLLIARYTATALMVRPLGQTAIYQVNRGPKTGLSHTFERWAILQIGRVTLRIVDAQAYCTGSSSKDSHSTTPIIKKFYSQWHKWSGPLVSSLLIAFGLSALAVADWLRDTDSENFSNFLFPQLEMLTLSASWLLAWTIGSKLLFGSMQWRQHFRIVALGTAVYGLVQICAPSLAAIMYQPVPPYFHSGSWFLVVGACALFHLAKAPLTRARHLWLSIVMIVISLSGASLQVYEKRHYKDIDGDVAFAEVLPVGLGFEHYDPQNTVLATLNTLRESVDRARTMPQIYGR